MSEIAIRAARPEDIDGLAALGKWLSEKVFDKAFFAAGWSL